TFARIVIVPVSARNRLLGKSYASSEVGFRHPSQDPGVPSPLAGWPPGERLRPAPHTQYSLGGAGPNLNRGPGKGVFVFLADVSIPGLPIRRAEESVRPIHRPGGGSSLLGRRRPGLEVLGGRYAGSFFGTGAAELSETGPSDAGRGGASAAHASPARSRLVRHPPVLGGASSRRRSSKKASGRVRFRSPWAVPGWRPSCPKYGPDGRRGMTHPCSRTQKRGHSPKLPSRARG
ncbi:hypothetical protein THAOC_20903, partial [Thalassiosira oceanica]